MKKLTIIYSLLFVGFANAQFMKYGLTANFHKGSIAGIHDKSNGNFAGGIGAFADIALVQNDIYDSAWLYFTPQLEFSMEGEKAEGNYWSSVGKDVQKYDNYYVAIPLYIKYFLRSHGYKTGIYFMLGPKFEFLVSDKTDEKQAISDALQAGLLPNKPEYLTNNYKETLSNWGFDNKIAKFGYGVSVAAGVKINDNWDVFLRFDRGLSKVYPDYKRENTYNRFLAIGINYYIGETD